MKIFFLVTCFYIGQPFCSYLMFKSKNAIEVSFSQQLTIFSYAFVPFIPGALFIFCFQAFYRVKLFLVLCLWLVYLYYIYKQLYDLRVKYFDQQANKNLAWLVGGSSFVFTWVFKSYFMQI
mmetsp:Transcript_8451/g.12902  ORF Transcript_8451/g.12902 Transcript_8451/m.12902 type:complete len:121 (-) Transcript_8451:28-390(-)